MKILGNTFHRNALIEHNPKHAEVQGDFLATELCKNTNKKFSEQDR